MSNETKIGLLAVVVIAIFIWGYKFLKGQNILTTSQIFYVEYERVDMLAASAPVFISGLQVGVVQSLYLKEEDMQTVVVVLNVDKDINVPSDATAAIVSNSIMSGPSVELRFAAPCQGANCAQSGDYLKAANVGFLDAMIGTEQLETYTGKLGDGVKGAFDEVNKKIGDEDPNNHLGKTLRDLEATMANLEATTASMNQLLVGSSRSIKGTMANLETITASIATQSDELKSMIANANAFSKQLSDMDLDKTMQGVNATFDQAQEAVAGLKMTLESTDKMVNQIGSSTTGLDQGEGTMGKLLKDEELDATFGQIPKRIDSIITHFQDHP